MPAINFRPIADAVVCTCATCRTVYPSFATREELERSGRYIQGNAREVFVCNTCLSDFFYSCSHCGTPNLLALEYRLAPEEDSPRVCSSCAENIVQCSCGCGATLDRRDRGGAVQIYAGSDSSSRYMVRPCVERLDIPYCESHGIYYDRPAMLGSMRICPLCYEDRQPRLHGHSYKPTPKFLPLLVIGSDAPCYYGVELEVEDTSHSKITETMYKLKESMLMGNAYFKSDGSLNDGLEIVSHPATLDFHLDSMNWGEALQLLRKNGFRSHDTSTCGLHVHASVNYLTQPERVRLGVFVAVNQGRFEKLARRTSERWCKFKKLEDYDMEEMAMSESRYEALNWTNEHTVEFRVFKGTLNEATFFASLELVDACMNFVKEITTPSITEARAYHPAEAAHGNWDNFCKFVAGRGYKHLPEYMASRGVFTAMLSGHANKDFNEGGC